MNLKQKLAKHKPLKRTWWDGSTKTEYWAHSKEYNKLLAIAKQQAALIEVLVSPLDEVKTCLGMDYWGSKPATYGRTLEALQTAKEAGFYE